jgi:nucleoside-diphosphate-sugar epimerase
MTVLVTGASGVVGRAVVAALDHAGMGRLAVVRSGGGAPGTIVHDLTAGGKALVDVVPSVPSAVIHLAAAVPHGARYSDTIETAAFTRAMDLTVFVAAKMWNCPVVYISGCALYDSLESDNRREEEDSPPRLHSPYLAAKWDGERLFRTFSNSTIIRLSAPLGPGLKSGLVVSRFIEIARRGGEINVWGSGTREQNFVDVRDVSELLLRAVQTPRPGVYNCAADRPVMMVELAKVVIDVTGRGTIAVGRYADPREGEKAHYSIEKTKSVFGWQASVSLAASLEALVHEEFEE